MRTQPTTYKDLQTATEVLPKTGCTTAKRADKHNVITAIYSTMTMLKVK